MSAGLQHAGIEVLAGIDNAKECKITYEQNIGAKFIKHDIGTLTARSLGERLGIQENDPNLVFAGCSPCQFWSKLRTDKTKSEKTAFLLKHFRKFIKAFRPGFVIVENVPGLYRRTDISILPDFIGFLETLGYSIDNGIVNANHYGVPQRRLRYLLIASRSAVASLPPPSTSNPPTVRSFLGVQNGFARIPAGHRDDSPFQHTASGLADQNLKRIILTKSGGDRSAWRNDQSLQIEAYKGRDDIFRDVYGRMSWDKPAPTITTRFNSLSNGRFGHPDENRAISLREGASLQTFPKDYYFTGNSLTQIARQIGNAVPPKLAWHIGKHLIKIISDGKNKN